MCGFSCKVLLQTGSVFLLCQELSTERSTLDLKRQLLKGAECVPAHVPVCIHAFECVFEEDKAEEEECKTAESEKGDGFSSHSGSLFSSKMYFQVFYQHLSA